MKYFMMQIYKHLIFLCFFMLFISDISLAQAHVQQVVREVKSETSVGLL